MGISFVSIDFETANSSRGSPCAVGMTKVIDGSITSDFYALTKPPKEFDYFDGWNISIHGITPTMVKDSKRFGDLWPEVRSFIGELPVVAHNAGFDLGVIREALTASKLEWPNLKYVCTMVLARRIYQMPSYRLPFVAEAAEVEWDDNRHHDARYDSEVAARILISMANKTDSNSIPDLLSKFQITPGVLTSNSWNGSHYAGGHQVRALSALVNHQANQSHPLYGASVCITGALQAMVKAEAWARVGELGGIPSQNVTASTNFLVVGEQDARHLRPGSLQSLKFQKAARLREKGQEIEVISESDFIILLEPMFG